jgi:CRISPR/Cas system CSM-associated protein Csm3 (group 7 of RAMP superfamily)
MFQQRCNELHLTMRLTIRTPLLINADNPPASLVPEPAPDPLAFFDLYQAEQQGIHTRLQRACDERQAQKSARREDEGNTYDPRDKLGPDMQFIRTWRNGRNEPYLPGAGLKGVLRSHSEQLLRTFLPADRLCDLFDKDQSCTKIVQTLTPDARYAQACPSCRLFGCGGLASRLHVSDAYLVPDCHPHWGQRSGVGINRARGVAETNALFFYEVLEAGAFLLEITLENFELWQVGLLAHTFHDLWHSQLSIGYGAQRGLGLLTGKLLSASLTYFGLDDHAAAQGCTLHGIDTLYTLADQTDESPFFAAPTPVTLTGATCTSQGLRHLWMLPATAQEELWTVGATALTHWLAASAGPTASTPSTTPPTTAIDEEHTL